MQDLMPDQTTIRTFARDQRMEYANYLMFIRKKISARNRDMDSNTETALRMPVDPFYYAVIDIGNIFRQIRSLVLGEESDDQGILRPRQFALDRICQILVEACRQMPVKFPDARVAPDLDGGLRIEWRTANVIIRLVIPPKTGDREYIYVRENGASHTHFTISGELLATCLQKVV